MMEQQAIRLRAAKPDFDEGLVFARYLDEVAEGFFRLMLGPRVDQILASAYTQPNNDFSYQFVTFAERANTIIGMVSGYSALQQSGFSDQPLLQAVGKPGLRMIGVSIIFAPLLRFLSAHSKDDFYLQAVAVDPAHQGRGVGSILLDAIETQVCATGSNRLTLHVSGKNKAAIKLYEYRGMSVAATWPKRLIKRPLIIQMSKVLANPE